MKKNLLLVILLFIVGLSWWHINSSGTGAPPYVIEDLEPPEIDLYDWMRDWVRPEGPAKVGLQVGHWKNEELPEELSRLVGSTGSSGGGKTESEVVLAIAEEIKKYWSLEASKLIFYLQRFLPSIGQMPSSQSMLMEIPIGAFLVIKPPRQDAILAVTQKNFRNSLKRNMKKQHCFQKIRMSRATCAATMRLPGGAMTTPSTR